MAIHLRTFNALTGGVAGALDSLSSGGFSDGDISRVITATGIYFYSYDLTSGAVESSPSVIAPDVLDATAINGRHLLMFKLIPMDGTQDVEAAVDFTVGILIDGPKVLSGTGSPEGVVTAAIGSIYLRKDGGAGTTVYTKISGVGNTGWSALTVYTDTYTSGNATFTGNVTVEGTAILTTVTVGGEDVTADLGKLHDVTADATELNQCDGKTLVNTTDEQSVVGPKTFADGLTVTGGPLLLSAGDGVARITGATSADQLTSIHAGGYTRAVDSALIQIYSKDHATHLGKIRMYGTNGTTYVLGLEVNADGSVSLPVGLSVAGVATPFIYEAVAANGDLSGTLYLAKSYRNVVMSFASLTHASGSSASSNNYLIPAAYRPVVAVVNDYNLYLDPGRCVTMRVSVSTGGAVSFYYLGSDGLGINITGTAGGTISWVSAS